MFPFVAFFAPRIPISLHWAKMNRPTFSCSLVNSEVGHESYFEKKNKKKTKHESSPTAIIKKENQ